ncbi:peptidoglycan recognition protein family protein [Aquimarina intermedia]|uniref:N-acetylmuramoyl-L-alanine amidase n=1 Tax=Aquimarina intermedia TaxID=350814 RepID=A0A5S5C791_9FLAO|nr:peptidoglycan-binding domain-containing protein [Aquimarina intermedia]TYP75291.1 N-acetylmuramoyl-L-alanine amidase [Aquimarina intermedia]
MKTLKRNQTHRQVLFLQKLLQKIGYTLPITGFFDELTDRFVRDFQQKQPLGVDGIVGTKTWKHLLTKHYDFSLNIKNYILTNNEWFPDYIEKDTIYLHHTAGLHRPDYTIDWWEKDSPPGKVYRVGTSFVIGRKALNGDSKWDSVTYRAFNEIYWCHHLGTKFSNNKQLNQKSIGIEICCLGPLVLEDNEFYYKGNHRTIKVPANNVCTLESPWRGHLYFQKYTDAQIEECKRLILTLAFIFDIPLANISYNRKWFDLHQDAKDGKPGVWAHCNVRADKTDCFPQPELISMLNSLYEDAKTFLPSQNSLESFKSNFVKKNDLNNPEIEHYTEDLNFTEYNGYYSK